MNRTTQALTILMIISYISPTHTMDNNRAYYYTGFGAVGGAVFGALVYNALKDQDLGALIYNELMALDNENRPNKEKPYKPKENSKPQSRSKKVYAAIKTLGAAAIGAVIGAYILRTMYWDSDHGREQIRIAQEQAQAAANQRAQEQARIAQEQAHAAQERDRLAQEQAARAVQEQYRAAQEQARPIQAAESIRNAQNNLFLNQNLNLQAQQEIEAAACRHYRFYPVLQAEREMASHAINLQTARDFYHQAGDNAAEQQANQLMIAALDKAAALRQLPRYVNETQNEEITRARINKENARAQKIAIKQEKIRCSAYAEQQRAYHEQQEVSRRAEVERARLAIEWQRVHNEREEAERRAKIDRERLEQNYAHRY